MIKQLKKARRVDAESKGQNGRCDLRILNAIRQIIRAADVDSHMLANRHKITAPQLMCLMAVVEKDSLTAIEIARRIHLGSSTLVGILDRLEAKGLVRRERNVDDRREIAITPTPAGRELAAKTPYPLQHLLDKALRKLSKKDCEQIAVGMERLVELMGATEIDASPMLEIVAVGQTYANGKTAPGPVTGLLGTGH